VRNESLILKPTTMSKAEQAAKEFLKTKRIRNKQLLVTLPSREREYFQMNKLLEDFATSQPFNQQIEQLTQERDELKNDIENIKLKVKRISKLPESLTKQLSAEKQKNEELSKSFGMFLDRVGDALEDNQSFGYLSIEADEIQQLLNK
tara:strand:+ start:138 stop:581 length:444 start_codon:yes stop_codon:yes gene_type:complete